MSFFGGFVGIVLSCLGSDRFIACIIGCKFDCDGAFMEEIVIVL